MSSKPSRPYPLDLQFRGHIQGLTYLDTSSQPLCHYFGDVPYALPPLGPFRFQKPRQLPPCYRYGTKRNPAIFTGGCGVCPQPGVDVKEWDEDCLQCNIWVPIGDAPEGGWPVMVYIHGGFLQYGTPNALDLRAFLSSSPIKCIVVAPSYRLNIFGFLASSTLPTTSYAPNLGFWDQRLALEWTFQNINYFGGNASNITLAGYSAGSHSVFHQLRYDICVVPNEKGIIKRVMMLSNGPGLQPKSLEEVQEQFIELLSTLHIPSTLSPTDQLSRLRSTPARHLVHAVQKMALHQFRGVTDNTFIHAALWPDLTTGYFASRLIARQIPILIGECSDEHFVYATYRPPSPTYSSLQSRLLADYPASSVARVMKTYFPSGTLPVGKYNSWKDAFGRVYADIQIHALVRAMVHALMVNGAGHLLHRYRVEWRAGCVDEKFPRKWGATHTSDLAIWLWDGLAEAEKGIAREFIGPVGEFVQGKEVSTVWGTQSERDIRILKSDGRVEIESDGYWDEGMEVWRHLVGGDKEEKAKL